MKHRLFIVNVLLLALIGLAGWRLRQGWLQEVSREQALWSVGLPKVEAPPVEIPGQGKPAVAAGYVEVAEKLLVSRDRNPSVLIEVAAPKPLPAMPKFYGVMNLGGGPSVILAPASGGKQRAYRLGEMVGELKLRAISRTTIDFEWEEKILTAKLSDMLDRAALAAAANAAAAAPEASKAAPQTTRVAAGPAEAKPGVELGAGVKACVAGDSSPAGTVRDGYKKVISATPFGEQCRWEQSK